MFGIKGKSVGPDVFMVPDLGPQKDTTIKYNMRISGGKMSVQDQPLDLGQDSKMSRSEIRQTQKPNTSEGYADQVILDPEDMEPTTRKKKTYQTIIVEGGKETTIKTGSLRGRTKRRTISLIPTSLGDTRQVDIKQPKLTPKVKNTVRPTPTQLGDTRDASISTPTPKLHNKERIATRITSTPTFEQEISQPHLNLRNKKGPTIIPREVSSGFQTSFDPVNPTHRAKLRKEIAKLNIQVQADPELFNLAISNFHSKVGKKVVKSVQKSVLPDHHQVEVHQPLKSKHKNKTHVRRATQVQFEDEVEIEARPRSTSRRKKVESNSRHLEEQDEVPILSSSGKTKSKKVQHNLNREVEEDFETQIETRNVAKNSHQKSQIEVQVPESSDGLEMGAEIKLASRVKKTATRMSIEVPHSGVEFSYSSKPMDLNVKKGSAIPVEPSAPGDGQVEISHAKVKKTKSKQPESMEVKLYPTDVEAEEGTIALPKPKERVAKAQPPNFAPTQDNCDVEIEKGKKLMIFT